MQAEVNQDGRRDASGRERGKWFVKLKRNVVFSPQIKQTSDGVYFLRLCYRLLGLHYEILALIVTFFHGTAGINNECNWDVYIFYSRGTYVRTYVRVTKYNFLPRNRNGACFNPLVSRVSSRFHSFSGMRGRDLACIIILYSVKTRAEKKAAWKLWTAGGNN